MCRDARLVTFRKSGSLGIQVQGGNKVGIFVAAVKEGSAAHDKGLRKGDQILMVGTWWMCSKNAQVTVGRIACPAKLDKIEFVWEVDHECFYDSLESFMSW